MRSAAQRFRSSLERNRAAREGTGSASTVSTLCLTATSALVLLVPLVLRAANAGMAQAPENPIYAGGPPVPRYALIDFGTNFAPMGINNSNIVVGNIGPMTNGATGGQGAAIWSWSSNSSQALPVNSAYAPYGITANDYSVVGIDDAGNIAGNVSWHFQTFPLGLSYTNSWYTFLVAYWANSSTAPVALGEHESSVNGQFDPLDSWVSSISDQGYMVGVVSYENQLSQNMAVSYNTSMGASGNVAPVIYPPAPYPPSSYYNNTINCNTNCNYFYAGGATNWCGQAEVRNNTTWANYPVINGTIYTASAYTNIDLSAINDTNIAVGSVLTNSIYTAVMVKPLSGTALSVINLGPGRASYLNNQTNASGAPAPQIIGNDTNNIPMLWDQTTPSGSPAIKPLTGNYVGKTLTSLLSNTNNWSMTSVSGINNLSSIIGTATYTPTGPTDPIPAGVHGVLLAPSDYAPAVLKVNSSFNEQKINLTTGYAQPDNYDEDLKIHTGPNAGTITVTNLHHNFFGIKPGKMPNSFFQNAVVTITKLNNTDMDDGTGLPEPGTIRLYAIQNLGQSGEQAYPIPISLPGQTLPNSAVPFTTSISTSQPANLVPVLYSASAAIPQGSNVTYYMEGVDPGPITLEYRIHFTASGSTPDVVVNQHFLVCTQQSKAAWAQDVEQEILLQSTNTVWQQSIGEEPLLTTVDMNSYSLGNNFMTNRPYLQSVYGYYQELFAQKPQLFYWAGLAKLAGSPVYAGLSDMQWAQSNTGLFSLISFGGVTSAGCTLIQGDLMQGNSDIFNDLAWQFRAYQASGIWALQYTSQYHLDRPSIRDLDLSFWDQIFQGDVESNSSSTLAGNFNITQREQQYIVQPAWTQIALVPGAKLLFPILAKSPVDNVNDASFTAVVGINGDITQYPQRWIWITDSSRGIWHDWTGLSSSAQSAQTSIDLRTRAAQYSFLPNQLNIFTAYTGLYYPIW